MTTFTQPTYLADISSRYMDLSPTGTVILGFLTEREMSGYDIKAEVDVTTRFFWSASYGQIYPELKRLSEAGLITGAEQPQGERRRVVYRITPQGRAELKRWLLEPPETLELRHEGLLKVFFSDTLSPAERSRTLTAMADQHRRKLAELEAVHEQRPPEERTNQTWDQVLDFGLEFNRWIIDWCERADARNEGEKDV